MSKIRAVLDTSVLVAAFRSRTGASFEIFRRLRLGEWTAVLSNHLTFEYEEVLKRDAAALSLSVADIDALLNAICAQGEEWPLTHNSSDEFNLVMFRGTSLPPEVRCPVHGYVPMHR